MHSSDLSTQGLFVSRMDHDGYDSYLDLLVRQDYMDMLKKGEFQVEPTFTETTYQGHPAYTITLQRPKDKMGIISKEIITMDKQTHLPYLDDLVETGRPDGIMHQKTTYTFSTDFGNDVFNLKAPIGYTFIYYQKF